MLENILKKSSRLVAAGLVLAAGSAYAAPWYTMVETGDTSDNNVTLQITNTSAASPSNNLTEVYVPFDGYADNATTGKAGWAFVSFSGIDVDGDGIDDEGFRAYSQLPLANLKPGEGFNIDFGTTQSSRGLKTPLYQSEDNGQVTGQPISLPDILPSITGVTITASPYTDDDLTGTPQNWDHGTDLIEKYNIWWEEDGVTIPGQTTNTLDSALTSAEKDYEVFFQPTDGVNVGPTQSVTVSVLNSLPVVSNPVIAPSDAYADDDLSVTTDTPGDLDEHAVTLSYQWYENDVLLDGETGSSLSSSQTSPFATYRCDITPNDGFGDGATVSASITVDTYLDWVHYVDTEALSNGDGTFESPWDNLVDAFNAVPDNGAVKFLNPVSDANPLYLDFPVRVQALGGTVRLGAGVE